MNRLRVCLDSSAWSGRLALILLLVVSCFATSICASQPIWKAVGPAGGDARAFAAVPGQPQHLYLGTTNSWLYESANGGMSWHRLSRLDAYVYVAWFRLVLLGFCCGAI